MKSKHADEVETILAALVGNCGRRIAVVGQSLDVTAMTSDPETRLENWEIVAEEDAFEHVTALLEKNSLSVLDFIHAHLSPGRFEQLARAALSATGAQGRIAFLLGTHRLSSLSHAGFRSAVATLHRVDWIVWSESPHTAVAWTILIVRPTPTEQHVVRLVDARGIRADEASNLIAACKSRKGGEAGRISVLRDPLPVDAPWTWDRLSRAYITERTDVEALGPLVPLRQFAEVRSGLGGATDFRTLETPDLLPAGMIRVFQGSSIGNDARLGTPTVCMMASGARELDLVRAGDILLARVTRVDRPLRIAVVKKEHEPAAAADSVIRVRLLGDLAEPARELLIAYLGTQRVARALASVSASLRDVISLTPAILNELLVPRFGEPLLEAMDRMGRAQMHLQTWSDEVSEHRRAFLDAVSFRDELPLFLARSRVAWDQVAAAMEVDTLGGRVRQRFPHPLALRRETIVQMEHGADRVRETLACAEHLVQFLAFLGLLNFGGTAAASLRAWTKERGSLSLDWGKADTLLREAASHSNKARDPLLLPVPEIGSLHGPLSDKTSPLNAASRELMRWRNDDSHLARSTSDEAVEASIRFTLHLDVLFEAASMLTQTSLVEVEDYRRDLFSEQPQARFVYLVGVSAAFTRRWQAAERELVRGDVGLLDTHGSFHSLSPWVLRRPCEKCKHSETFVLSRFDSAQTKYIAMESGHALNDATLAAALTRFVTRHGTEDISRPNG